MKASNDSKIVALLREINQLTEEADAQAVSVATGDGDILTPINIIRARLDLIRARIDIFLSGHDCALCRGTGRRGIMNQIVCNHGLQIKDKETT